MAETAEELCQKPDVRQALAQTTGQKVGEKVIKKLVTALNTAPDKVMFPAGAAR